MSNPSLPSIRFFHSPELRERTIRLLEKIEQSNDPKPHRGELGNLIVELTNVGLNYFFIRPLELAKVGFVTRKSANLGMAGAQRVMGTMIRRVVGGMDRDQLQEVCTYVRQMMV